MKTILQSSYLCVVFCFAFVSAYTQSNFHWVKRYGSPSYHEFYKLSTQDSNGNIYTVELKCTICGGLPNDRTLVLKKIDTSGNILSQYTLPDSLNSHVTFPRKLFFQNNKLKLLVIKNFYYLVTPPKYTYGWIFQFDTNLTNYTEGIFSDTSSYLNNFEEVYPLNNSEVLYTGLRNDTITSTTSNPRFTFARMDTANNISWEIQDTAMFQGSQMADYATQIIRDVDSNFISIGRCRLDIAANYTPLSKTWLRKFDSGGNQIWDYKIIDSSMVQTIAIGNDSNLILGGTKHFGLFAEPGPGIESNFGNLPYVAKFNPTTNQVMWLYRLDRGLIGGCLGINPTVGIQPTADGLGYVILANTIDTPCNYNYKPICPLVKLNENGQVLWKKTFILPTDTVIINDTANYLPFGIYLQNLYKTNDGGYLLVGDYQATNFSFNTILIKTNCNGDTASPKASMNILVDPATPNQMLVYNLSQFYDTCVFSFNDGSADVILTMYDTAHSFTHAFTAGTTVTCIAKACNQEWDTLHYTQIITSNALLQKNEMGMIGEVYPNPANTQVSLNYFLGEASQAVVSVSSTTGHVLYQEKVNTSTGTLHINTSNLSNGMYLLKVQSNNGASAMKKLMILH